MESSFPFWEGPDISRGKGIVTPNKMEGVKKPWDLRKGGEGAVQTGVKFVGTKGRTGTFLRETEM